jgi:hypothetical protein
VGLDILTPRGQQTLRDLNNAVALWEVYNPGWKVSLLPDERESAIDGFLVDPSGQIKAGIEVKCRYGVTRDGFRSTFNNEWLVTMRKLTTAWNVCSALCVPLVGFLYLVDDRTLLTKRILDAEGDFCAAFSCDRTETQKTVNGGKAERANAFINMEGCREYCGPKKAV